MTALLMEAYLAAVTAVPEAQALPVANAYGTGLLTHPLERGITIEVNGKDGAAQAKALKIAQELRAKLRALGPVQLGPIRRGWHYSHSGGTCLAATAFFSLKA